MTRFKSLVSQIKADNVRYQIGYALEDFLLLGLTKNLSKVWSMKSRFFNPFVSLRQSLSYRMELIDGSPRCKIHDSILGLYNFLCSLTNGAQNGESAIFGPNNCSPLKLVLAGCVLIAE